MKDPETCERCGHRGTDVLVRLVRYDEEAKGRMRTYFATEWRCDDRRACDTRASFSEVLA